MPGLYTITTLGNGTCRALAGAALTALLFLSGCGGNDYPPVPESQRQIPADYNYLIGPGDVLEIFVWGNIELSSQAVVRPDGKVTTRLVDPLENALLEIIPEG